jgi:tRNA(fMet)-specific endonuclease VapC
LNYILDTNTVSLLARKNAKVVARYSKNVELCAVSSFTWYELQYGVARMKPGTAVRAQFEGLYRVLEQSVVAYDRRAAEWHAKERVRRTSVNFIDALIAATAASRGLVLVTQNLADFKGFKGLKLEDWSR